jgi:uracil-DNA glycosylase
VRQPDQHLEIERIAAEIRACRICIERPSGKPLPHLPRPVLVPSSTARVLIAGQAPGTKVHASGIPFDDASGDRLRHWLGVSREQFYDPAKFAMAAMGFCFPGQDARGADLPPRRECAPTWRDRLIAAMPQVDLVLAIGMYAQSWHLKGRHGSSLTETIMQWREIFSSTLFPRVIPLPHPSWRNTGWLKRNPWFEKDLLPRLKAEIAARL